MNDRHFDSLTRRASIVTPGVGGSAAVASPFTVAAKQKHKNASNTKAKKRCQSQIAQCTTLVAQACPGDAACVARLQPCCTVVGQCDFSGFITCLQQAAMP